MAWLHATPKGSDRSRGAARKGPWPLPPCTLPDVTALLWKAGPGIQTGDGLMPLTAQELQAWAHGTQHQLSAWEFQAVLDLSSAYCNQFAASKDPLLIMPWVSQLTPARRKQIAASTKALFRS